MMGYSDYKETGVEWLGNVPKEWNVTKLKFLGVAFGGLTYSPQDVVDSENEGVLVLRSSNIQDGHLSLNDNVYVNTRISEKLILRKGDILICSRNGSQRLIGKNICIDERMAGNTFGAFMMVFRSEAWKFLSHYFNSPIFTSQSALFLTATINQLTSNTLNNFWLALPNSSEEQTQIAQYLDHKTAQIDKLIGDKEKLIELLIEERIAIINKAVTKGVNPEASMKDSGIDWLGEVPERWGVGKLKLFCDFITDGSHYSPTSLEVGKRYISVKDVKEDAVDFENCKYISNDEFLTLEKNGCRPQKDDILLTKDGTIGRACLVGEDNDFVILSSLAIIRVKKGSFDCSYLKEFLVSQINVDQMLSNLQGSALTRITLTIINNLFVVVPPREEQEELIVFISSERQKINTLMSKILQEIQLLKEYKSALISEVVTGKVDVRDEVIAKSTELVS